jgi:hypothetical protein
MVTDGRQTKSDYKSSPCHFVSGELNKKCRVNIIVHCTFGDHKFGVNPI